MSIPPQAPCRGAGECSLLIFGIVQGSLPGIPNCKCSGQKVAQDPAGTFISVKALRG
jgi:hypothetical protein